jgi:hypothetical protein
MDQDIKIQLFEFYDLLEYTLSFKFREKWKNLYSGKMIKLFQLKLLHSFKASKPIKRKSLVNYLMTKGKYSKEVIEDFFSSIDIDLYRPFIS